MNLHQRKHWVFPLFLVLYEISTYLSNDMYLPALPDMMRDLHLSATRAELTVTMWFLGAALTPLIMGAIADRFGRKPTLFVGGVIYVIATILCAEANSEFTLLASRILQGAMISSMMVAGYAVIHELYEQTLAIRILAIMGSVSVLAPALGPLFGAAVLSFGSWRSLFWIIAVYSSAMLLLLYPVMPETLSPEKRQTLHLGTLLENYWKMFTNKQFLLLMTVLGFSFVGFIGWITAGPLLVIHDLKYSKIAFGWMQAAVFAAYILGSHFVNNLAKKHTAHRLANIGLSVSLIAGCFMVTVSLFFSDNFYLFLIAMIVYSFGSAICFSPLNRLIIETSEQPMGLRVALFTAGLMIYGVLGSAIAGLVYNGTSFSLGVIIAVGIVIACALQYANEKRILQ